ncbi:hypothetical protein Tco_0625145 [Tanacetum coccineum]|uniref:Uncharacterized protein n=1 Tax=Tanacetum coccineum TaxID=301880 RepID=A0ABQ4WFY6_9ASTR
MRNVRRIIHVDMGLKIQDGCLSAKDSGHCCAEPIGTGYNTRDTNDNMFAYEHTTLCPRTNLISLVHIVLVGKGDVNLTPDSPGYV